MYDWSKNVDRKLVNKRLELLKIGGSNIIVRRPTIEQIVEIDFNLTEMREWHPRI